MPENKEYNINNLHCDHVPSLNIMKDFIVPNIESISEDIAILKQELAQEKQKNKELEAGIIKFNKNYNDPKQKNEELEAQLEASKRLQQVYFNISKGRFDAQPVLNHIAELEKEKNEIKKYLGISEKTIMQRLEELQESKDKSSFNEYKYEQALKEIRKTVHNYFNNDIWTPDEQETFIRIMDKINEVLNEEN